MDNASPGVGLVSQTGNTAVINQEYAAADNNVLDTAEGDLIPSGNGTTSRELRVDQDHQWVSAISMLVPSPDRLVGVANLRLCDGDRWRESVKVCFELFSTATATDKVVAEMERNSLQANNCSFGYVEFNLPEVCVTHSVTYRQCIELAMDIILHKIIHSLWFSATTSVLCVLYAFQGVCI